MVAALSVSPVLAAKGGNGQGGGKGKGGNGTTSTATVCADPSPARPESIVRVKGCGFSTDFGAEVHVEHNGITQVSGAWVWANGCIDLLYLTGESGIYGLSAFQASKKGSLNLVAEGSLEVQ